MPLARLRPPVQGKLYAATLSPQSEGGSFFIGSQLFFTLGDWGFFAETGYFSSPAYETRGDGALYSSELRPHPVEDSCVRGLLLFV